MRGRALTPTLGERDARAVVRAIRGGDLVLLPVDTVYGIACDPDDRAAVERLYRLKGRPADKPSALMAFALADALELAPDLGARTRAAVERLLPGPVGVLVPGPDGTTLGLRVPDLPWLAGSGLVVLQSSANLAGEPDAARLADVPRSIREGCDLVLDGGELPGLPSTLVDLTALEADGGWRIVREGLSGADAVGAALAGA